LRNGETRGGVPTARPMQLAAASYMTAMLPKCPAMIGGAGRHTGGCQKAGPE
jgi:hypothetical protein